MRLTDLHLEQFGTWKDHRLPLRPHGLTVVHGPNGTGKSTLLEFIRSTLFGHDAASLIKAPPGSNVCPGTLWFEVGSQRFGLSRRARPDHSHADLDWHLPTPDAPHPSLATCLGAVDRDLFDGVFCLGLSELQELNALNSDQVANHIFEASLDPATRGLLRARDQGREDRSPTGLRGRLTTQLQQLRAQRSQLPLAGSPASSAAPSRFAQLRHDLDLAEQRLQELTHYRRRLEHARHEADFREQCRGPQRELREIRQFLETGRQAVPFPDAGLERLRELDERAHTARAQLRRLRRHQQQIRAAVPRTGLTAIDAAALAGFLAQREWFTEVTRQQTLTHEQFTAARLRLEQLKAEHAPGWSDARLAQLPHTPEIEAALVESADRFRRARWRYARLARLWRSGRARLAELAPTSAPQPLATPPAQAMASVRQQLDAIPRAALLRARETGLRERLRDLQRWASVTGPRPGQPGEPLPSWLSLGISLFFFLAILLAGWGLIAGVSVSALAGLIYLFMGIAFGGLAWGLKSHFETHSEPDPHLQQQQHQQQSLLETELQSVRRDLQSTDPRGTISDADPLAGTRQAAAELARLAELAHVERHSGHLRQRFRRLNRRLKVVRQQYRVARAHWHEQLTQLGLEPSDDVEEVLQSWARLGSVAREQQLLTEIIRRGEVLCELWRAVEADAAQLALRLPGPPLNSNQLLQQFDHWRQLLADWQAERLETRSARLRGTRLQRRFHRARKQLEQLDAARELLWQQAGTSDRASFLAAAGHSERRGELLAREAELHSLLHRLEQSHTATPHALADLAPSQSLPPDTPLAPLPDDLDAIVELLRQVDEDLAQATRRCATLRGDFDHLAQQPDAEDARCAAARFAEREQQLLDQLAGLDLAGNLFDQQLAQFEARHQPETLELASRYLASLTGDRFRRVWTALGERHLQVEDSAGDSFRVEALSRGGREQLYLALRLALIERLHARGIEMPLLLDDVFSNFDEARSHNAIDVLLDFARRGHQVVYITCHQQLARQFEDRGQHTVWLAGPPAADQPPRLVG